MEQSQLEWIFEKFLKLIIKVSTGLYPYLPGQELPECVMKSRWRRGPRPSSSCVSAGGPSPHWLPCGPTAQPWVACIPWLLTSNCGWYCECGSLWLFAYWLQLVLKYVICVLRWCSSVHPKFWLNWAGLFLKMEFFFPFSSFISSLQDSAPHAAFPGPHALCLKTECTLFLLWSFMGLIQPPVKVISSCKTETVFYLPLKKSLL